MVLSTLQTTGILVGIAYYIMTLNYSRKNQQLTLKNRQGQLLWQMIDKTLTDEGLTSFQILRNAGWSSYEDWKMKYGDDAGYMKAFNWVCQINAGAGVMIREDLGDIKMLALYASAGIIPVWDQYREIVYDIRKDRGYKYFENWEIGYNILKDYLKEHPEIDPFIKEPNTL